MQSPALALERGLCEVALDRSMAHTPAPGAARGRPSSDVSRPRHPINAAMRMPPLATCTTTARLANSSPGRVAARRAGRADRPPSCAAAGTRREVWGPAMVAIRSPCATCRLVTIRAPSHVSGPRGRLPLRRSWLLARKPRRATANRLHARPHGDRGGPSAPRALAMAASARRVEWSSSTDAFTINTILFLEDPRVPGQGKPPPSSRRGDRVGARVAGHTNGGG